MMLVTSFTFGGSPLTCCLQVTILNYALTLEHLEDAFYRQVLNKYSVQDFRAAGYPKWVRERVEVLAKQEASHVAFLSGLS